MFKSRLFIVLVLIGLTGCARLASVVYPVNEDAFKVQSGDYVVDPSHATVIFGINHLGFSTFYGRFETISGRLAFNAKDPASSSVAIEIDTASISTNSGPLDEELRASAMFDSENVPTASYVSTGITITGDKTGTLDGLLTIKEVTRPVQLLVTFGGSGTHPISGKKTVGFNAEGRFKRSEFGLDSWLPIVGDEVNLIIEAEFNRP